MLGVGYDSMSGIVGYMTRGDLMMVVSGQRLEIDGNRIEGRKHRMGREARISETTC